MKTCPKCQTELPDQANFCFNCGPLQQTNPGEPSARAQQSGSGAIAQDHGAAAGAGGMAVIGDIHGNVTVMAPPNANVLPSCPNIYHNLPHPDFGTFIGREEELKEMHHHLRPSPHSQYAIIVIDGAGGIGKSALALEVAHHYLRDYDYLSRKERFEAIIWISAQPRILTTDGIAPRPYVARALEDIYATVSIVLGREDIIRALPEEQNQLVRRALNQQRTLLLLDNLEEIGDDRVIAFLRELPAPTKAIVTTRRQIDVGHTMHLTTMTKEDSLALIASECTKKGVILDENEAGRLYDCIGGVPLAIVWSIAQRGMGYRIEDVLPRLKKSTEHVTRFCFEKALKHIRGTNAHKLLVALAMFATSASRATLVYVGELGAESASQSEALVTLTRLSLINHTQNDRFWMLPLAKEYVLAELGFDSAITAKYRERQAQYYLEQFVCPTPFPLYTKELVNQAHRELENFLGLLEWCWDHKANEFYLGLFFRIQDFLGVFGRLELRMNLGEHAILAARDVGSLADLGRLYVVTMGWAAIKRGELAQARKWLEEGLEIAKQSGDRELECVALRFLGRLEFNTGQIDQARQIYQRILTMAQANGFKGLVAALSSDLAYWEMQHGSLERAESYIRESIRGFQDLNDSVRESDRTIILANILVLQEKYPEAKAYLLPHLAHLESEPGQPEGIAAGYACLAHICAHQGDIDEAIQYCTHAKQVYDKIGMQGDILPIGLPTICQ